MNDSNKKKLSFFLSSFRAGGGERNMVNLANSFSSLGFDVDMPVIKPVGQYEEQIDKNINIINVDAGRVIFTIPKMVSYLKKEKPDVIIATDEFTHIISLVSKKISGVDTKVVFRMGNMFSVLFSKYKGFKQKIIIPFIAKRIYKYADIFIANSHGVAEDVSKIFNVSKNKIKVIHNPKEIDFIRKKSEDPVDEVWLNKKDLPVVLFVGRLREQKDIPTLIRAFAKVRKKEPSRLLFVGVGREKDRLQKLVNELGIEDFVKFYGFADNPYSFMSKADVFVTTSIWEGFSNSLQEALVCEAPVVATDCSSGPREMLAPDTDPMYRMKEGIEYAEYGVLVPVGNINSIANAITEILRDQNKREQYKQKSFIRGNDFDSEKILDQYKKVFRF